MRLINIKTYNVVLKVNIKMSGKYVEILIMLLNIKSFKKCFLEHETFSSQIIAQILKLAS